MRRRRLRLPWGPWAGLLGSAASVLLRLALGADLGPCIPLRLLLPLLRLLAAQGVSPALRHRVITGRPTLQWRARRHGPGAATWRARRRRHRMHARQDGASVRAARDGGPPGRLLLRHALLRWLLLELRRQRLLLLLLLPLPRLRAVQAHQTPLAACLPQLPPRRRTWLLLLW